eukprot:2436662-Rhodomonas_salina.1
MSVAQRNHTELQVTVVRTALIDAHSGTVTALALDLLSVAAAPVSSSGTRAVDLGTASPPLAAGLTLGSRDQPSQCAMWVTGRNLSVCWHDHKSCQCSTGSDRDSESAEQRFRATDRGDRVTVKSEMMEAQPLDRYDG